ncbi:hypothetical protein F5X68DRAFT_197170 [Plectosphaerella plurivora]|uniref:Zn(2)-C6 fungal-type domain-containing protein n=1 Tax=Plectosphaerella plurivora TaxID=936078 RepID=A0A9P9AIF3_9PEZI|nr:hypothetical protein F5X68DRAFT_197170 [Plectosphaerella plurivora]
MSSLPWRPRQDDEPASDGYARRPSSSSSDHSADAASAASHHQKLSRTSTAKVRTGCVTCKKRHVKCDETKPFCMNCLRIKGFCEGYAIKPRKKRAKPAPKVTDMALDVAPRAQPPVPLLEPNINSVDFADQQAMFYFDEFIDLAARYFPINSAFNTLWTVTLPQLARTNDTLRHAAIAIGALSKAHEGGTLPELPSGKGARRSLVLKLREESPHYHNAIVHYCAALRLQGQAQTDTFVVRSTVFLSILFICFELIRGDRRSALSHINYGMALLYAVLHGDQSRDHIASLAPDPKYLLGEVADTYIHLAAQSRSVLVGKMGEDMPLKGLSRDLEKNGLTVDMFFLSLAQLPRLSRPVTVDNMPPIFRDIQEAEQYWVAVQTWAAGVAPALIEMFMSSNLLELDDDDEINATMLMLLQDPKMIAMSAQVKEKFGRFNGAFMPLYHPYLMREDRDRDTYLRLLSLRLQCLMISLFISLPDFGNVATMESLTPVCREMMDTAEVILRTSHSESSSPVHHLSLDGGVLIQITFVAFFCRDPLVREAAIRLLEYYPHQNGLWDSNAHLALAIRNRGIERNNASEGTPTEQWLRLWRREHIFEDAGKRVVLRFMDKNPETGKWELVEECTDMKEDVAEMVWRRQPLSGKGKFMVANILGLTKAAR